MKKNPSVSFGEAVKTCFNKYATFKGRARRSEYWWFILFNHICLMAASLLGLLIGGGEPDVPIGILMGTVMIGVFLPSLAVTVRRLHDTGRSGWCILLNLLGVIPYVGWIGGLVVFLWTLSDSDTDENAYGPSPKYQVSEEDTLLPE